MLQESKLISYMSKDECYAVHLFDGQKIIHDLVLIHELKGEGFLFYRDCVLSSLPLIALLKHGETLGFYIDSPSPYFAFKVEMSEHGHMRTLMLPSDFKEFPQAIHGRGRLTKMLKGNAPYNSIVELKNSSPKKSVNQIIKESYQLQGEVLLSKNSDQAALLMKLPRKSWDKEVILPEGVSFEEFSINLQENLDQVFNQGAHSEEEMNTEMSKLGFMLLKSKEVSFKCSCSRERMVTGVSSLLGSHTIDEIFLEDQSVETKCDYCNTFYQITKAEVRATMDNITL